MLVNWTAYPRFCRNIFKSFILKHRYVKINLITVTIMYVVAYFIIPVTIFFLLLFWIKQWNNAQKIKITRTSCPFLYSVSDYNLNHAKSLWILVSFFEEKIFTVLTWYGLIYNVRSVQQRILIVRNTLKAWAVCTPFSCSLLCEVVADEKSGRELRHERPL